MTADKRKTKSNEPPSFNRSKKGRKTEKLSLKAKASPVIEQPSADIQQSKDRSLPVVGFGASVELRMQQIKLEMQNEELRKAQLALEESRDKYIDLYDFAPAGYFTFTREALIKEVNLTGAALIGVERQKLINARFRRFIVPEDHEKWDRHILSVFELKVKQVCDLKLRRADGSLFYARLESIRLDLSSGILLVQLL